MNWSPLHELHEELGARFVDFGGWEMPVHYGSVLAEHRAVRQAAGWFDVSHLGRFELTGSGAAAALSRLLCNDLGRIGPGRTQYTLLLNPGGGIVDDLIVWWWDDGRYWVLPNAANHDRVMAAFAAEPGCEVDDLRPTTAFIAVQGPAAPEILASIFRAAPTRFRTLTADWHGVEVRMAGTGYTGERGGEVCLGPETAQDLARALIAAGVEPCGLGARDTLRLESGLPLWGSDLDETTTPLEGGLDFAVSMGHDFIGRDSLLAQQEGGIGRRLTGFVLEERGIPRHGHRVRARGGEGTVTSGNLSPMLDRGVGLAYLPPGLAESEPLEVSIRERWVPGRVARPPFHKEP